MGNASTRREATLTVEICMNDLTVSGAKALARGMIERMAALGVPLTYAQALEAVAASHQYTDWNRFLDALKKGRIQTACSDFVAKPVHRLIVSLPGHGSSVVLEHEFERQTSNPQCYPILIELGGFAPLSAYFSRGRSNNVRSYYAGYNADTGEFSTVNRPFSFEGSGAIIYLCAVTGNGVAKLKKEDIGAAWDALLASLGTLFSVQQLERPGMLAIRDYDVVDSSKTTDFDVTFPSLTGPQGPFRNKSLLVVTQTDKCRQSLYRSPDAWRLIMMAGDESRLFYRCPFEKVCAYPFSEPVQSFYKRVFVDPSRQLEDAALFVGQRSSAALVTKLPNKSDYGESLVEYMIAAEAWARQNGHHTRSNQEKVHLSQI
jgi:hypothetical protein